jgi:hypothetical protein
MVRGGLPSRLLAQNNSHHERLLIGGGAADLGELREAAGAIAEGRALRLTPVLHSHERDGGLS